MEILAYFICFICRVLCEKKSSWQFRTRGIFVHPYRSILRRGFGVIQRKCWYNPIRNRWVFLEISPKTVGFFIFFFLHVFPHHSAMTASISDPSLPDILSDHRLPRVNGFFGQFDFLGDGNCEKSSRFGKESPFLIPGKTCYYWKPIFTRFGDLGSWTLHGIAWHSVSSSYMDLLRRTIFLTLIHTLEAVSYNTFHSPNPKGRLLYVEMAKIPFKYLLKSREDE